MRTILAAAFALASLPTAALAEECVPITTDPSFEGP